MKILKHGDPEITKHCSMLYTCDRCGCEFTAVAGEVHVLPAETDPVKQLRNILEDVKTENLFKVHCPDCGKILSKTTAEVEAYDAEMKKESDQE